MVRNKLLFTVLSIVIIGNVFGGSLLDSPPEKSGTDKQKAAIQIESTFAPSINEVTLVKTNNKVNWSNSGLQVSINNNWQITIKSQEAIHIDKIKIGIDNDAIENQVNIDVSPNNAGKYLFASDEFTRNIKNIVAGQTILGIVQNLNIDDYQGYKWYSFKKFNVTITYIDFKKNYNEISTRFIMVLGK